MSETDPSKQSYTPYIVDLGRRSRKEIRRLKNHQGKLMDEVDRAVAGAAEKLGVHPNEKIIIPVVFLYRQKRRRGRGGRGGLPFPFPLPFRC